MKYLLALVLLGCVYTASCQRDVNFKRLETLEGEPVTVIQFILQDSEGYIWLAAHGAELIRLDGQNRRKYSATELANDDVSLAVGSAVFEDSQNNVMVATDAGNLLRYNRMIDKFEMVNDSASNIRSRTHCMFEEANGTFWLGTLGGGLIHFNPTSRKLTRYQTIKGDSTTLSDDYVVGIERIEGKLWVATTGGLCSLDSATNQFTRYPLTNVNTEDTYRYRVIRDMLHVGDKFFLSTYGGLQIFDIPTLRSEHLIHDPANPNSLPHNSLFKSALDPDGTLWLASYGGGLINLDLVTRKFSSWKNDPYDQKSLSSNNLFYVFVDRQGILWAGVADNALCLFDTNAKRFHSLVHKASNPNGISSGWIHSILQEDDSTFWLGYNGSGLNRVNINTGIATKYVNNPADKYSLGADAVSDIHQDRSKRLWVGLSGGGLNMLDQSTGRFTRFESGGPNTINNNAVSAVFADPDDLVWTATYRGGLNIYDINKKKFRVINDDSLKKVNDISLAFTHKIFEWKGNIVFKTQQQIALFDKTRNRFVKLAEAGEIAPAATASLIEAAPFTETELLLFTKKEVKLVKYIDPDHIEETVVMQQDPEDELYKSFVVDSKSQVWCVTTRHLVKLDLKTGKKKLYTHSDGILPWELVSLYLDRQGRIIVSSIDGLNWFHPEEIQDDVETRAIRFTDFKLYNRSMKVGVPDSLTGFTMEGHISMLPEIELQHDQSFFSIEFSAMEFIAQEKIQYAYKLEGFDKSWVQVGNQGFGSYTNLDAGHYTFYVKCANPDGYWGEPISLAIIIHPPFWQRWWFLGLVVMAIGLIAYYVHNYRLAQSLKIERLRNKIASDLHDEVGSSLTRVSIYSDLLKNESTEGERQDYLGRISSLSREVVGTMSDIVWSIDSQSDSLGALLLRMKDFATEVLQSKNIDIDFRTSGVNEKMLLDPALRQNIYLIFKEAINNLVKHSEANEVVVEIHNDASEFKMRISDNGGGFDKDHGRQGNGLRNMNRRGQAAGGVVLVDTSTGGTIVTFKRKPL